MIKALGKPDRVNRWTVYEGSRAVGVEDWLYGTDGPKGAATLASFQVVDGRIGYHPVNGWPPSTALISEADLRKGMHLVLDAEPAGYAAARERSRWVAKTVNGLLPFGEAKCKAIFGEVGRVLAGEHQLDPNPFFVCYALFDPPAKPGYFDSFGPVWSSNAPTDHLKYPRCPVEIIDNQPVVRGAPMGGFGGFAPSFQTEFDDLRSRIHLRSGPLTVPK